MNFICATVPVLKIAFMIQARLPAFQINAQARCHRLSHRDGDCKATNRLKF